MTSPFNMQTFEDGSQSLTISNVDVTFNNFDPTTGAASITITASNGFSSIPGVVQGAPGQPTLFSSITYVQLAYDATLPDPNPAYDLVNPGGAGESAIYSATFYGNAGPPGTVGSFLLSAAEDVIGLGEALIGQVLSIVGLDPLQFGPAPSTLGKLYYPTTINNTTSGSGEQRTLATIPIADEYTFDYWPDVEGQAIIDALDGTAQVNIVARLNNATTGDIIATGLGVAGQQTAIILSSGPPADSEAGYGIVESGHTATIYINAEQQGGTPGDYSTTATNCAGFSCGVQGVQ